MVDYNIYNIKQLEFRLDMKINCVYIYKYIASEVPSIIYTYNIHINIYFFFFLFLSSIFPLSGYLGSCSEPLLRRGKHTGILELFSRFENTNIK
jgi:hypothetical protein